MWIRITAIRLEFMKHVSKLKIFWNLKNIGGRCYLVHNSYRVWVVVIHPAAGHS